MPDRAVYIGRFAPTPSGPLHFGSLVSALASYLDARAHQGRWLVRIEDLDPPREMPGAAGLILRTLEAFGLHWDGDVVYQSARGALYQEVVEQLLQRRQAFACSCSRKELSGFKTYPGHCREVPRDPSRPQAIRLRLPDHYMAFEDRVQGPQRQHLEQEVGDFIIKRKDGLYAYQLAVVLDDAEQGVTHVVRGSDLLESTARQIYLQQLLALPTPSYAHLPVVLNPQGQKLSKQNLAKPIDAAQAVPLLYQALNALGQQPPTALLEATRDELLHWATAHWRLSAVPRQMAIPAAQLNSPFASNPAVD